MNLLHERSACHERGTLFCRVTSTARLCPVPRTHRCANKWLLHRLKDVCICMLLSVKSEELGWGGETMPVIYS